MNKRSTNNELTTLTDAAQRIDMITGEDIFANANGTFLHAVQMAEVIDELRGLMSGAMLERLASMANAGELGFKTDKSYTPPQMRDALIEACLRGYRVVGNEFAIISGRFYAQKAGLMRKVRQHPDCLNVDYIIGTPEINSQGAKVPVTAELFIKMPHGKQDRRVIKFTEQPEGDFRIPCKVNAGQGADAVKGKAERKLFMHLHNLLIGVHSHAAIYDDIDDEPTTVEGNLEIDETDHPLEQGELLT